MIPESFDLRSIDGFDFTNPLRDQGACGSCYTVSFTQVIESRLKQRYGKKIPVLSPQYLMMCNYLNEGCDGGWSFFHGFLAENGYLVSESAHHTKPRRNKIHAAHTKAASQLLRLSRATSLAELTASHQKRK